MEAASLRRGSADGWPWLWRLVSLEIIVKPALAPYAIDPRPAGVVRRGPSQSIGAGSHRDGAMPARCVLFQGDDFLVKKGNSGSTKGKEFRKARFLERLRPERPEDGLGRARLLQLDSVLLRLFF